MRLTLRTLLAYLDDTLPAGEIKAIGQKVAESDAAQELVARLKAVTRRRRLTAPPATGPNGLDPNRVAEYLDNVLDPNELADLEKLALESDVHLAEIAACHQILTLVLGEPALVPPTARERMYALVHGREAIPFRKAAPAKKPADGAEEDEPLGMGGGWLKWVLPAAGMLLLAALALAVYQVLPPRDRTDARAERRGRETPKEEGGNGKDAKDKDRSADPGKDTAADKDRKPEKDKDGSTKDGKDGKDGGPTVVGPKPLVKPKTNPGVVDRTTPPTLTRVAAGQYVGPYAATLPGVFVSKPRQSEKEPSPAWRTVDRGGAVFTDDALMALPGYTSVVRTSGGAGLLLRGHVREFSQAAIQDDLAESVVKLHQNDSFDLDVTLLRGRLYISNRKPKDEAKGQLKVRLRFETEVWDMMLEPGTEVGLDLIKRYMPGVNYRTDDEPHAALWLCLLRGELELKTDAFNTRNLDPDGKVMMLVWDSFSKVGDPVRFDQVPTAWSKTELNPDDDKLPGERRTVLKRMNAALFDLQAALKDRKKAVGVALKESLTRPEIGSRMLAVYCLGALDDVSAVVDALGDENTDHRGERDAAIYTLRRWITRSGTQGKELFNAKDKTGVLIDKKYKPREAETIFDLLHDFPPEDWGKAETFEALARGLGHRRTAVAELAFYHLVQLSLGAKLPGGFNAAAPQEDRENYAMLIVDMINKKKLPPPPPAAPERPPAKDK